MLAHAGNIANFWRQINYYAIIKPMKVKVSLDKAYRLLNFGPTVLVTSQIGGKPNIMPVAWNMPVDFDPPKVAICIGDQSYTFHIVRKTGEFVINIPPASIMKKVFKCGRTSGKKVDKFKKFGLTAIPASKVKPPMIKECIGHLECKVIDESMAEKYNIFIVQVVACSAEKGALQKFFRVDKGRFKTLHHLTGNLFFAPGKVIKA